MTTRTADPAARRRERIETERRERPESRLWLELVELALEAAAQSAWSGTEPRLPPVRDHRAPLLHDAFVAVDRRAARRFVRSLLKTAAAAPESGAATLAALRGRSLDPLELIAAAVGDDADALKALAANADADPAALAAVARFAALPLLQGCARALASKLPLGWARGYCPVCGGWPIVAELRGLERTRVLRCGRCATGWELPLLACPFCDEREHERHFSFAAEGEEQRRRVDACRSCDGYVKTITTLGPLPDWSLPLEDLASVELDLVADERGLRRPEGPGFPTAVRLVAADGPLARLRGGWA